MGKSLPWQILRSLNYNEIVPFDFAIRASQRLVCQILPLLCDLSSYILVNENILIDNVQAAASLAARIPAGTSVRNMEHLSQIYESRRFQNFDYGVYENFIRYGNQTPPVFDLTQITGIPIAVFMGSMDAISDIRDNEWVLDQIRNVLVFERNLLTFGHFNYFTAEDTEVYLRDVVELLSEYNQAQTNQVSQ